MNFMIKLFTFGLFTIENDSFLFENDNFLFKNDNFLFKTHSFSLRIFQE